MKTIYGLFAMAAIASIMAGCSDNTDIQYEPTRMAKSLTATADPQSGTFYDQKQTLSATTSNRRQIFRQCIRPGSSYNPSPQFMIIMPQPVFRLRNTGCGIQSIWK